MGASFETDAGHPHQRVADHDQRIEDGRLPRHADETHADQDAEHDDGGHERIGVRVEGVGRDEQAQEVGPGRLLDQARAEERGRRPRRKRQRHQHDGGHGDGPEHEDDGAALERELLDVVVLQGSEPRDQRHGDERDHRDLQQPDEHVSDDLEPANHVTEEHARNDAEPEADQNLSGQGQPTLLRRPFVLLGRVHRWLGHASTPCTPCAQTQSRVTIGRTGSSRRRPWYSPARSPKSAGHGQWPRETHHQRQARACPRQPLPQGQARRHRDRRPAHAHRRALEHRVGADRRGCSSRSRCRGPCCCSARS